MKIFKNISLSITYFEEAIQCSIVKCLSAVLQFKVVL